MLGCLALVQNDGNERWFGRFKDETFKIIENRQNFPFSTLTTNEIIIVGVITDAKTKKEKIIKTGFKDILINLKGLEQFKYCHYEDVIFMPFLHTPPTNRIINLFGGFPHKLTPDTYSDNDEDINLVNEHVKVLCGDEDKTKKYTIM